jgi:hypothetical protein
MKMTKFATNAAFRTSRANVLIQPVNQLVSVEVSKPASQLVSEWTSQSAI